MTNNGYLYICLAGTLVLIIINILCICCTNVKKQNYILIETSDGKLTYV